MGIIGQLLSDLFIYRSSPTANLRIEWSFGLPYYNYGLWINSLFSLYINTPLKLIKSGLGYRLKSVCLPQFNYYHEIFYVLTAAVAGNYVKIVPAHIGSMITPIVLAHLLMGDGSYYDGCVYIWTNAFTKEDCQLVADAISSIGIRTTVRADRYGKDGTKQYKLVIASGSVETLQKMVKPYMHPSLLYRIGICLLYTSPSPRD